MLWKTLHLEKPLKCCWKFLRCHVSMKEYKILPHNNYCFAPDFAGLKKIFCALSAAFAIVCCHYWHFLYSVRWIEEVFVYPSGWTFNLPRRAAQVCVCSPDMWTQAEQAFVYLIVTSKKTTHLQKWYVFLDSIPDVIIDGTTQTNLTWVGTSLLTHAQVIGSQVQQCLVWLVLVLLSSSAVWQPEVLRLLFTQISWKSSLNHTPFFFFPPPAHLATLRPSVWRALVLRERLLTWLTWIACWVDAGYW